MLFYKYFPRGSSVYSNCLSCRRLGFKICPHPPVHIFAGAVFHLVTVRWLLSGRSSKESGRYDAVRSFRMLCCLFTCVQAVHRRAADARSASVVL